MRSRKPITDDFDAGSADGLDLDSLLHPAGAFEHPAEVVNDPDLTLNEKRAILASWASDACAVEAAPELRCAAAQTRPVRFDEIMDARARSTGRRATAPRRARVIGACCGDSGCGAASRRPAPRVIRAPTGVGMR